MDQTTVPVKTTDVQFSMIRFIFKNLDLCDDFPNHLQREQNSMAVLLGNAALLKL